MVFQLGPAGLVRSDARWSGSQYTYWWAYTFYDNPLPVSLYAQETSQWCWAASGQMIMTYLGYPVRQCDQANYASGRSDCCNSPIPSSCVFPGWPDLNHYGFNYSTTPWGTALSWASLRSELVDIGRPVGFSWGWTGDGGHMMVAIGAKTVGTSNYVTVNNRGRRTGATRATSCTAPHAVEHGARTVDLRRGIQRLRRGPRPTCARR
jgi:hypothetical protein